MLLPPPPVTHLYQILLHRAEIYPGVIAIGGQEGLTWKTFDSREMLALTNTLASELSSAGIRGGDRVVLWLPNAWRTPVYLFALWKLGAIVVPFDPEMNPEAASRIIQRIDPRCTLIGYHERPSWTGHAQLLEWWSPGARSNEPLQDAPWTVPNEQLAAISFTSLHFSSNRLSNRFIFRWYSRLG
jgi:acyl-CoA synthetase (AMP-forming)/AMP-acid ligase II